MKSGAQYAPSEGIRSNHNPLMMCLDGYPGPHWAFRVVFYSILVMTRALYLPILDYMSREWVAPSCTKECGVLGETLRFLATLGVLPSGPGSAERENAKGSPNPWLH